MNFSCLSEVEARRKYEEAVNKKHAIKVIADLTDAKKSEVKRFLGVSSIPALNRKPYTRLDSAEARKLYDAGLSDLEIATRLGVTKAAVATWRRKQKLPVHTVPKRGSEEERMALYRMGLNDVQIGAAIGLTPKGVTSWRSSRGLPANATQGGDHRKKKVRVCCYRHKIKESER